MTTLPPIKQVHSPNFSDRDAGVKVDLVVVHRPVGSYLGSINVLCEQRGQDSVSAQGILGRPKPGSPLEFTQLVGWNKTAWHAMAFNSRSDGLEIADAAWDGTDPEAWKAAARIVAFRLKKRGLKPRWARNGQGAGFCRHYDLGAAGGGHTDPTTSTLLWLRFVVRVKWEFICGGFRADWGVGDVPPPAPTHLVYAAKPTTTSSASHVTVTFKPVPPAIVKKPKPDPLKPKAAPKKKPKAAPKKAPAKPATPKPAPKRKPKAA